jgi:hypothetical protein
VPTKPQDIVVAIKLCVDATKKSYAELGQDLGMSASEVHAAVRRLGEASLVDPETREVWRDSLRSFLIHGLPYVFPAKPGEITRGLATAWGAPVMAGKLGPTDQATPVWPDREGQVQGAAVYPLYSSVPGAARRDPALYDLLALIDAIRIGRARERNWAEQEITQRLSRHVPA